MDKPYHTGPAFGFLAQEKLPARLEVMQGQAGIAKKALGDLCQGL